MNRNLRTYLNATAIMALLLTGGVTQAAMIGTFVAAVDGVNSFRSSNGTSTFSTLTATSGSWHNRPGVFNIVGYPGSASGAYQGQNRTIAPLAQTHNEVVTTLSSLDTGVAYDIYMVYGVRPQVGATDITGQQNINAGFVSGSLTTLTEVGGTPTGDNLMTSGWVAAQQLIGRIAADANGQIKVYVGAPLNAERSVYNGLSYVRIPEPSCVFLLGLGMIAVAVARRRR